MPYQKPGAYARFVRTAGAVDSPGATRVMAIVGTGTLFFDTLNAAVLRTPGATSDELSNANVYEIYEIADKPMTNGVTAANAKVYTKGVHFDLVDNKTIAWKLGTQPVVTEVVGTEEGPIAFAGAVSHSIKTPHLVKDGRYRVQITYIDNDGVNPKLGTYTVVDNNTEEVLGEYTVGTEAVNAIPGIDLIVTETFFAKMQGDGVTPELDSATGFVVSQTEVGDYVIIETTSGVLDNTLTPALPAEGDVFYASYGYKKPESAFVPKVFTDYQSVVNEYGNYDVTASGKVTNSLALAAEIAFLNGAQPLVLVQAKNDSDFEMKKAIDKLERDVEGITNINSVVALTESKVVGAHLMTHVVNMSSPTIGKERMMYFAAATNEAPTASAQAAKDFSNERVVYVAPGAAVKEIKDINTGKVSLRTVPGAYPAVAVAAVGLMNDPAEPLTLKNITGFTSLGVLYTEAEKNIMAEQGVLVLEQYGAAMRIRHGITTSTAEVNSSEITLVQIKDYVIEAARTTLGELYVGRKLMPTVVGDVQNTLQNILAQFVGQEVIISFDGVSVARSAEDPRAIDVVFEIEAVYPLNYVNISFSFSGVN